MAKPMICFDMDGTIADLYNVPNWLERLQAEDATPYLEAKPLWDMECLNNILMRLIRKGWEVRIITWLSKDASPQYKAAIRAAKLAWLKRHKFPYHKAHMIAYGTTKANCVRHVTEAAILIDDNETVCHGWRLGGTIDPRDTNVLFALEILANRE